MKTFALLFGTVALMLHMSLSSLPGIKKCRKLFATSGYISISNKPVKKDQLPSTAKPTDGTCNISTSIAAIEQNKELPFNTIPAMEFSTVGNYFYAQQYLDPPFAPPRREKNLSSNFFYKLKNLKK